MKLPNEMGREGSRSSMDLRRESGEAPKVRPRSTGYDGLEGKDRTASKGLGLLRRKDRPGYTGEGIQGEKGRPGSTGDGILGEKGRPGTTGADHRPGSTGKTQINRYVKDLFGKFERAGYSSDWNSFVGSTQSLPEWMDFYTVQNGSALDAFVCTSPRNDTNTSYLIDMRAGERVSRLLHNRQNVRVGRNGVSNDSSREQMSRSSTEDQIQKGKESRGRKKERTSPLSWGEQLEWKDVSVVKSLLLIMRTGNLLVTSGINRRGQEGRLPHCTHKRGGYPQCTYKRGGYPQCTAKKSVKPL